LIGIGIDAVDLARFRAVLERRPGMLARVFSDAEREAMARRVDPVPGLAARFCAKEATLKAFGAGLGAFDLAEVEVVNGPGGAPMLRASGRASELAASLGVRRIDVSLTHTAMIASAVVVAS
jgi:holo-[acyl-carrier protein] synthase